MYYELTILLEALEGVFVMLGRLNLMGNTSKSVDESCHNKDLLYFWLGGKASVAYVGSAHSPLAQ